MKQWTVIVLVLLSGVFSAGELLQIQHLIPASWSDLYPQWFASRAALRGEDPYSDQVTEEIQQGFYGRALTPQDKWDRQNFVYPATLVVLLAPLTLLPWHAVRVLVTLAAPLAIAVAIRAWILILGVKPRRELQIAIYGLALTSWPAAWAYQQTQPTIFIFAALSLSLLYYTTNRDVPAGILLALSTVKPTLIVFFCFWILFDAILKRRRLFLLSFTGSCGLLFIAAALLVPAWLPHWISTAHKYASDPLKVSLLQHLLGLRAGVAAAGLAASILLVQAWGRRNIAISDPGFGRISAALLAFTVCAIPITPWMVYDQLLLIPAILVLLFQSGTFALRWALGFLIGLLAITFFACSGARFGYLSMLSWMLLPPAILAPLLAQKETTMASISPAPAARP